ncbi:twinfilin-1 [Colletotrichum plurivorum]|uniref:Twinfilin-1 n=1 Tax=Colletotrichum plurivorum TaxID=2175906 RepID=A0A8H6N5D0_9PEZI|nr:twinfilin-1 [Colletotrichum plurivorum]
MSALLLILAMGAMVAAQASHAIHGFEYFGCVNITSDKFVASVGFPAAYTPEQCESACTGFKYAAAFADGCRCARNIESFLSKVDESFCGNPCNGDASFGYCGFSSSSGCSYANVYEACAEFPAPPAVTGPAASDPVAPTTYTTIRLPTVTRTLKLATKATVVVHTITQGSVVTSCPLEHDHTTVPSPADPSPTAPAVVVQTVVVNVPPQGSPGSPGSPGSSGSPDSPGSPGLQGYGSIQSGPPVATAPPAETAPGPQPSASTGLSLTTLVPYADPPVTSSPSNATITTSSPEGPEFRTILPEDPSATVIVPAVVTTAQAHRVNAGIAGVIVAAVVAAGI